MLLYKAKDAKEAKPQSYILVKVSRNSTRFNLQYVFNVLVHKPNIFLSFLL